MKKIIAMLSALAVCAVAPLASAEEATLQVSSGPASVLHAPWSSPGDVIDHNRFKLGMEGDARVLFRLVPNLSVGPAVSVDYFSVSGQRDGASVLWTFGGAVQLQGNHAAGWYPYLNVSGGVSKKSSTWNPEMAAAAGVNFSVEPTKTFWMGPFASWGHTFQVHTDAVNQSLLLQGHDLNTLTIGLSLAFDAPVHPQTVVQTMTITVPIVEEHQVVVQAPPAPAAAVAPAPVAATLQVTQVIHFTQNSSALTLEDEQALDQIASDLQSHFEYYLVINGSASSDGDALHNLALGNQRANVAADYLANHGVSRTRLMVVSSGATGPDASNRAVNFLTFVKN